MMVSSAPCNRVSLILILVGTCGLLIRLRAGRGLEVGFQEGVQVFPSIANAPADLAVPGSSSVPTPVLKGALREGGVIGGFVGG